MFEQATDRYFKNTGLGGKPVDAKYELLQSLERINTYNPPVQTCSTGWTFHGLYSGPTSIAYLFYRLHNIYPKMEFKGQSLLDWAQAYLDLSGHLPKPNPDPDHCGIANETLAYYSLQAVMLKDQSLAAKVCSYSKLINAMIKPGSNEWLYGRAGYLYFLRLLRSVFSPSFSANSIDTHQPTARKIGHATGATVVRILESPRPWTWHGKQYLGAAHGTIGIITQITLTLSGSAAKPLQDFLTQLSDQQYPSGNIPSSIPATSDKLVQFCHGSPGLVLSLSSIREHYPRLTESIDTVMTQALHDVWNRGLLTKQPNLCHGIAGNALALQTHEEMRHFLSHITSEQLETQGWLIDAGKSDEFVGLYTGEAGRAWAWAVLDQKLSGRCIGYNDI